MKTKKLFIAGLIVSAILFIAACAMVAVSAVVSKQEMDLGIDLSGYNVTKMHTDNETIRVFGTQDVEVFASDLEGEMLWDAGAFYTSPVYELAVEAATYSSSMPTAMWCAFLWNTPRP